MSKRKQNNVIFQWYVAGFFASACLLFFATALVIDPPKFLGQIATRIEADEVEARTEAEALFTTSREAVAHASNAGQALPVRISGTSGGAGVSRNDVQGEYYVLADVVIQLDDGRSRLVAVPRNGFYPVLHCDFSDADDYEIKVAQPAGVESMSPSRD